MEKCKAMCTFCNKYILKEIIKRHEKLCSRIFSCDECGQTFKRKFNLTRHEKKFHVQKVVLCDINDQSTWSESDCVPESPKS